MNNSFGGGSVSPVSGNGNFLGIGGSSSGAVGIGRPRYRPLMKNLHVDIPADQSQRAVFKTDGLISLKRNGTAATTPNQQQQPDLNNNNNNNNMHKLNLIADHYMASAFKQQQQQQYQYSPPLPPLSGKPSSIKTSISNFKLSGNDAYHYRNPAIKTKQASADEYDDYDESSCAVCDRKSTTIMCKNCGHDWVGRVRTKCQSHPSTVYLMDLEACTKCASKDIKELN